MVGRLLPVGPPGPVGPMGCARGRARGGARGAPEERKRAPEGAPEGPARGWPGGGPQRVLLLKGPFRGEVSGPHGHSLEEGTNALGRESFGKVEKGGWQASSRASITTQKHTSPQRCEWENLLFGL